MRFLTFGYLGKLHLAMEFFTQRLDNRKILVDKIVPPPQGDLSGATRFDCDPEIFTEEQTEIMKKLFFNLDKCLKTETQHQIDGLFLEKYILEGLVPRGLRINLKPTFSEDETFTLEWSNTLDKCAQELIQLLIYKRKSLANKSTTDISQIWSDLNSKFNTHPDFKFYYNKIQTDSQTNELEFITRKKTKIFRDREDKLSGYYRPWLKRPTSSSDATIQNFKRQNPHNQNPPKLYNQNPQNQNPHNQNPPKLYNQNPHSSNLQYSSNLQPSKNWNPKMGRIHQNSLHNKPLIHHRNSPYQNSRSFTNSTLHTKPLNSSNSSSKLASVTTPLVQPKSCKKSFTNNTPNRHISSTHIQNTPPDRTITVDLTSTSGFTTPHPTTSPQSAKSTTPTPFRAVINQLRVACNLPPRTDIMTLASPESLRKSYLTLRNQVSPHLLKSTLPLVSKALALDSPPTDILLNIFTHIVSPPNPIPYDIDGINNATPDSLDRVIIDNTQSSTSTVVPFLGVCIHPNLPPPTLEISDQNKRTALTDFFRVVNKKRKNPDEVNEGENPTVRKERKMS